MEDISRWLIGEGLLNAHGLEVVSWGNVRWTSEGGSDTDGMLMSRGMEGLVIGKGKQATDIFTLMRGQ